MNVLARVSFVYVMARGRVFSLSESASLPFCFVVADYIPRPGPERNSGNLNESICIALSMSFYGPG